MDECHGQSFDLSSVFNFGWALEEEIRWNSVQRTESPCADKHSLSKLRGVSKGPHLVLVAEDADDAYHLTGNTEKAKALDLIEKMRARVAETLRVSKEKLEELVEDGGISCLMDKLSECESSLLEKDRVSLVLLGRNGAGKSFLINILLMLTSPSSVDYGYRDNDDMSSLFAEEQEDYRNSLQNELEAVLELRKNDIKQVIAMLMLVCFRNLFDSFTFGRNK